MSLEIDRVTKRFGHVTALDGIEFSVPRGAIFGFLGANGAGKTTTMRICLGILEADSGQVRWDGTPSNQLSRRTWGYLPEERGLYARLPVLDQLVYFAELYGASRDHARSEAMRWLVRFRIAEYANRRAEELSKGNQQKVQFIAAILHEPAVLIMDEPFVGLDPVNVALLKEAFEGMRERGSTLIFSTHQMETVEELCDSVALIDRGKLVLAGPIAEVKRSTGRRVVRLGVESRASASGDTGTGNGAPRPDLAWISELHGVRIARPGLDYTELDIDRDVDPETVLRAALDRGLRVTHFQMADPSIEQIFIERVGRRPSEEHHLATSSTDGSAETSDPGTPAGAAS